MKYKGHTKKHLKDIYKLMYLSRKLDDKQLIMLKQGKGFFHIGQHVPGMADPVMRNVAIHKIVDSIVFGVTVIFFQIH